MTVLRESQTGQGSDGIVVLEKPTTLKPILDVIPDSCYQRSRSRGLGLVARDFILYGLIMWGLASTNKIYFLIPLWLLASATISGLFILGHDAAHGALFDSKRLNAFVARLTMLPSLHATEPWVFGHNRVHHGHTLREGMDFVWHPLTTEQYADLSAVGKLIHRIEWSFVGAGFYYTHQIWWNKMVVFKPSDRWAKATRRDQGLVVLFAAAFTTLALLLAGPATGIWLVAKMLVIPFLLFNQTIGWVVYIQHIAPDIRWWPRREWNRYRGQVEGTTAITGPPGWEFFFHWILIHVPHHVDMRIPCYHLSEATRAISRAFPGEVVEKRLSLSDYLAATKACKLHNFQTGQWSTYP